MIAEGLCTTCDPQGQVNLAPMGPIVIDDFRSLVLRPFPGSRTYDNLQRLQSAVFHITDDAATIALSAIDQLDQLPPLAPIVHFDVPRLADCVRWYALRVNDWDATGQRPRAVCQVVASGRVREFWGFNRARHALIEAAILATRLAWHPADRVRGRLTELAEAVDKTGGPAEQLAFARLQSWVFAQLELA
jgi:hypothetical protein